MKKTNFAYARSWRRSFFLIRFFLSTHSIRNTRKLQFDFFAVVFFICFLQYFVFVICAPTWHSPDRIWWLLLARTQRRIIFRIRCGCCHFATNAATKFLQFFFSLLFFPEQFARTRWVLVGVRRIIRTYISIFIQLRCLRRPNEMRFFSTGLYYFFPLCFTVNVANTEYSLRRLAIAFGECVSCVNTKKKKAEKNVKNRKWERGYMWEAAMVKMSSSSRWSDGSFFSLRFFHFQ